MSKILQIQKDINPLSLNIQRIGYVNHSVQDTRVNANPANTPYPVNVQEIPSLWDIPSGESLRPIDQKRRTFQLAADRYADVYFSAFTGNRNCWSSATGSDDVAAGVYTITLPVGTFTVWFGEDTGSVVSSNNTGTASKQCNVTAAGTENADTIVVTAAGTFDFTVTGNPKFVQIEAGDSTTVYQPRLDNTIPVVFNVGNDGGNQDLAYNGTGATNATMLTTDVDSVRALSFDGSNHSLLSSKPYTIDDNGLFTYLAFVKPDSVSARQVIVGSKGNNGMCFGINGSKLEIFLNFVAGSIQSPNIAALTAGQWQSIGVAYNHSTGAANFYHNGVNVGSSTSVLASLDTRPLLVGVRETSSGSISLHYAGKMGEVALFRDTVLTDSEILQIHNELKSDYNL